MARFASNQSAHARQLLDRISEVFVASGNIYESYDMAGGLASARASPPHLDFQWSLSLNDSLWLYI